MSDIQSIKKGIKDIFATYQEKGIQSIYFWGSVTTSEFDPKTSDIDCIAIINNQMDLSYEEMITNELQENFPEVVRFGFRFLYEDELRGGITKGSYLANSISPKILLRDLPYWELVAGHEYSIKDFTDTPPTYKEVLRCYLDQLKNKKFEDVENIPEGKEKKVLKLLWRVVYTLQLFRGEQYPFSYQGVRDHMQEDEKDFVDALWEVKKKEYSKDAYLKYVKTFNVIIDRLRTKVLESSL